ncbi:MAG: response regulator transcription factor [Candidatus Paceibacterota bacterium]
MRILVIEDEIFDILKKSFESECFAVDVATDGEIGSYLARTNDYDLIILDNILPKKNGYDVCKEIRKAGKSLPIIVLSVKSENSIKVDFLNAGADDYVTKPFSFEELLARVGALLRRVKDIKEEILKVDDLIVDIKNYSVKKGSKEIYLTRKEFILLQYLMKNKGRVLSRAMIIEHVWDMNIDPFSNTIETHILNLRRKISPKKGKKLIYTIPGVGYKLA